MKCKLLIAFTFCFCSQMIWAQQNVGIGINSPDPSAILDITGIDKGILVPRMSATQRQNIFDPATGLMVYDSTNNAFYYFNGMGWLELLSGPRDRIVDADEDTQVWVDNQTGADSIHFDIEGTEQLVMSQNVNGVMQMQLRNNDNNVLLGKFAGDSLQNLINGRSTFVGTGAGANNTSGKTNVFLGYQTGQMNKSGNSNVYLGTWAGQINNGSNNIMIGKQAGDNIQAGHDNIIMGYLAGTLADSASSSNIIIGYNAGHQSDGSGNTYLGNEAGRGSTGISNLYLGFQAGLNRTENNRLRIGTGNQPLLFGEFDNSLLKVYGTLKIKDAYAFPIVDGTSGQVLQTNGSGLLSWGNKTVDTDNQTIDAFALIGTNLQLSLEDDGQPVQSVDLSSIDTDTDDQTIDAFTLNGTNLELSLEDDGQPVQSVDLSSLDNDNQMIDAFSLNGTNLELSLEDDGQDVQSVDLSSLDTDDQTIDAFTLNGTSLELSLEDDGQDIQSVDLSSLDTDTDDQTIDAFTLNGTNLELSLEDDGVPVQSVDLSSINAVQSILADTDEDTKIQVEKNADDDQIRFDVLGQEVMKLDNAGLLRLQGMTNTNIYLTKSDTSYSSHVSFTGSGSTFTFGTPNDADRFRIWSNGGGSELMTFKPTGNVGIGVISPEEKLHVQGRIIATDTTRSGLILKTADNSKDMGLAFRNNAGNYTWSIFRADKGSNQADLVITGGSANSNVNLLPERMRFTYDGNIGIGTDTPDEKLHIAGNIKIVNGSEGAGKILMSDSDGVATWVDPNSETLLPDTTMPVPIKYHQEYIMVYPEDNAAGVDWQSSVETCSSLVAFGYDDWYLPSLGELNAMYKQSYLITGLSETGNVKYWSNTEQDINIAYTQRLDYGGPDPDNKTDNLNHHCRCVRQD